MTLEVVFSFIPFTPSLTFVIEFLVLSGVSLVLRSAPLGVIVVLVFVGVILCCLEESSEILMFVFVIVEKGLVLFLIILNLWTHFTWVYSIWASSVVITCWLINSESCTYNFLIMLWLVKSVNPVIRFF